jgi:histone H3/H4|tara:strand:+ start:705 stop:920 length:216 start_codon:yes stop_codon:yes gene_type:complete
MQRKTTTIPKASVARLLTKAGAKRVSESASATFSEITKSIALEIATKAVQLAHHSGRKTVIADDIKLAIRK